jgi:hypothetical protein
MVAPKIPPDDQTVATTVSFDSFSSDLSAKVNFRSIRSISWCTAPIAAVREFLEELAKWTYVESVDGVCEVQSRVTL